MRKKMASLLIVLSVTLNVAVVGFWAMRSLRSRLAAGGHCGNREVGCPLHRRLGTDPEQWQRIKPLVTAFRKESQAVCQDVSQARLEMLDLLAAPEPDKEKIAAKQEKILAGQRRVQELAIKHLLAEKELLTPEQCKELFDLLRRRSGCGGHDPRMGMPGGPLWDGGACSGAGTEDR